MYAAYKTTLQPTIVGDPGSKCHPRYPHRRRFPPAGTSPAPVRVSAPPRSSRSVRSRWSCPRISPAHRGSSARPALSAAASCASSAGSETTFSPARWAR